MAKRFTDTAKYKKGFIRGLPGAYKLLWDFLYHDCDHAGIWIVDFQIAQTYLGKDMKVNKADALKMFNADEKRIVELNGGSKWFIPSFIEFQYGKLSEKNRAHINVISVLKRFDLLNEDLSLKTIKPLTSPLQGAKEKEKEQEKEKVKEMEQEPEGGAGETMIVPQMWEVWKQNFPTYTHDKENDFPALGSISRFMMRQTHMNDPTNTDTQIKILNGLQLVADVVKKKTFWLNKPLKSIASNIQEFTNELKNGSAKTTTNNSKREQVNQKFAERYGKG